MVLSCCFFGKDHSKKENVQTKKIPCFGEIDIHEVTLGAQLGDGFTSYVYKANWNKQEVAIKCFKIQFKEYYETEKKVAEQLSRCAGLNDHIMKYYGFIENQTVCALLMEYMPKGDLGDNIFVNPPLDLSNSLALAYQVAQGLEKLHQYKWLHCDIKPENILITEDFRAKIIDFGTCIPIGSQIKRLKGTVGYQAPELLQARSANEIVPYSEKSDVYAYGMTLVEIINSDYIYTKSMPTAEINLNVVENDFRPPISKRCPVNIKNLLQWTWIKSPVCRIPVTEIIDALEYEQMRLPSV